MSIGTVDATMKLQINSFSSRRNVECMLFLSVVAIGMAGVNAFRSAPLLTSSSSGWQRECARGLLPPVYSSPTRYSRARRMDLGMKTLRFEGDSAATLQVSLPQGTEPARSLPAWLASEDSNPDLFGSRNYDLRETNGQSLWHVQLPSIGWLGLKLVPTFVLELDEQPSYDEMTVRIDIVDAKTELFRSDGSSSGSGKLDVVGKLMKKASFKGSNVISARTSTTQEGTWTLSADFSLTLLIPLGRLVLVPPGFNAIASRITRRTCRDRVQQNLVELEEAYIVWATTPTLTSSVEEGDPVQ
uniref:Uncharacterized protein n=1 Tax=Attheya septentrionalis TaxID=420275 RepID=A0A7S2U924_9STRA|mmetsp:Transcript_13919/g.25187  ORF Transcript_13919/g.25187 Transcript_13919/m.25187 type:complete len:300 (+) Transcript_13919:78-977(+)